MWHFLRDLSCGNCTNDIKAIVWLACSVNFRNIVLICYAIWKFSHMRLKVIDQGREKNAVMEDCKSSKEFTICLG